MKYKINGGITMEDINNGFAGKVFSQELYDECNNNAFMAALRDFKAFKLELKEEDYMIDVYAYLTEEDRELRINPIFSLELEVNKHMTYWTKEDGYPKNTVNFLARKVKFLREAYTPFYLIYNHDFTDCLVTPLAKLSKYQASREETSYGPDFFIKVPKDFVTFNPENIETAIIKYLVGQANAVYQAMNGTNFFIGEPDDYIKFAQENPDIIRYIANISNGIHQATFGHHDHIQYEI